MQLVLDDVRQEAAKRASKSHPGQQTGLFATTSSEW